MSYRGWAPYCREEFGEDTPSESEIESDVASPEPPDNIRDRISSLLKEDPGVTGAFSYSRTHTSWCNPGLDIDGFGSLGLPLNAREAGLLKNALVINGSHAQDVRHGNGEWTGFLEEIVNDVCRALGVHDNACKPRAELTDLLVNDAQDGSTLSTLCANLSAPAFATVVVVLPSKFIGGALQVTYGDRSETHDYSARAAANLTVLAWHATAIPEFAPLSEGHHLALCYRIIPTTGPPVPAISLQDDIVSRLRQTLSHWNALKREGRPVPTKLIHLLRHKYSRDVDLCHDLLQDVDLRTVMLLSNIGRLCGFNVSLADMTCEVRGFTNYEQCGDLRGCSNGEDSDESPESDDDPHFTKVRDVEITSLVDLGGKIVAETLDHDFKKEWTMTESQLLELLVAKKYDEQHYNAIPSPIKWDYKLRRVYRRTVAVLWPQWANFHVKHGVKGVEHACKELRACDTSEPSPEHVELVESILANMLPPHREAVTLSVCRVAAMWNDFPLWLRTVQECDAAQSVSAFGTDNVQLALRAFGFQPIQPFIEQALDGEPSDITALQFLDDVETWCAGQESLELVEVIPPWVAAQRTRRYNAIRVPTQKECAALTKLVVTKPGGGVWFRHKILPKIKMIADSTFLLKFSKSLQSDWVTELGSATLSHATHELLHTAVDHLHIAPDSESHSSPASLLFSQAKAFIQACSLAGEKDLVSAGLAKLQDITTTPAHPRALRFYFPLILYLVDKENQAPADLVEFCEFSLASWLDEAERPIIAQDLESLLRVVSIGGHWPVLTTRILPYLETVKFDEPCLRVLLCALHTHREHIGATAQTTLISFVKKWAALIPSDKCPSVETVSFPVTLGVPEGCSLVFKRCVGPSLNKADHIRDRLGPFLDTIYAVCSTHNVPLTSPHFAPTIRQILVNWASQVMPQGRKSGLNEEEQLLRRARAWTCKCAHCKSLQQFLVLGAEKEKHQVGSAADAKHVKNFLNQTASSVATWKEKMKPQRLFVVTKNEKLINTQRRKRDQEKGASFLKAIDANTAEWQVILGGDYEAVVTKLRGPVLVDAEAPRSLSPGYTPVDRPADMQPASGSRSDGVLTRKGQRDTVDLPYDEPPAKRRRMVWDDSPGVIRQQ